MARHDSEDGQASVELVGILPLVAVIVALLWQAAVAGQAVWLAGTAARAAARAEAVGGDAGQAARSTLPESLRHGLKTVTGSDGAVRVRIGIPSVVAGQHRIATVSAQASFRSQEG
ncbi:MAG: hypothetical protein JWN65_340 [Solirubrobacterales bacterium]|nr:hypothetical protein [Solirubrobacterales bacterium]